MPGAGALLALGVAGALVAVFAAAFSRDNLFQAQMAIFAAAAVIAGFALTFHLSGDGLRDQPDRYMDGPIRAGVIATMIWGVIGMSAGVFAALQLSTFS